MLVVCEGGQLALLNGTRTYLRSLQMRLYANDHTPTEADTDADYTEPSYLGYEPQNLKEWGHVRAISSLHAILRHEPVVFPAGGVMPATGIYGYWITDTKGRLIWAERRDAGPFVLYSGGPDFTVIPQLTLRSDPG